jgi:hypothetical protein
MRSRIWRGSRNDRLMEEEKNLKKGGFENGSETRRKGLDPYRLGAGGDYTEND